MSKGTKKQKKVRAFTNAPTNGVSEEVMRIRERLQRQLAAKMAEKLDKQTKQLEHGGPTVQPIVVAIK